MEPLTLVVVAVVVIIITILVVLLTQSVVVPELVVEVVDIEIQETKCLQIILHQLQTQMVLTATVVAVAVEGAIPVMVVMV